MPYPSASDIPVKDAAKHPSAPPASDREHAGDDGEGARAGATTG
jgi:hypothetical protein